MTGTYARIYAIVRKVPRGRVATYGQVARLAKLPGQARHVGYAMYALPTGTTVPWQRIINAKGEISRRSQAGGQLTQRMILEREGVPFNARGRIDLRRYGWPGAR